MIQYFIMSQAKSNSWVSFIVVLNPTQITPSRILWDLVPRWRKNPILPHEIAFATTDGGTSNKLHPHKLTFHLSQSV